MYNDNAKVMIWYHQYKNKSIKRKHFYSVSMYLIIFKPTDFFCQSLLLYLGTDIAIINTLKLNEKRKTERLLKKELRATLLNINK